MKKAITLSTAHKNLTQKLTLALSIGVITSQLLFSTIQAQGMFAGVTDINLKSKYNEQVISFKSDLPFQYEMQTLNPNQVLLRLHNARLSDEIFAKNGVLNLKPGKYVKQGVIRVNDASNIEEIVLSGPGLGGKKITVNGAEQLSHADDIIQMPMVAEMNRQQDPYVSNGRLPEAFGMAAIAEAPTQDPVDVSVKDNQTVTIRPAEFDPEYNAQQRKRFLAQTDQAFQNRYQPTTPINSNGNKSMVYFPTQPQYQAPQIVAEPNPQYTPWQNQNNNATRIEPTNVLATTVDNASGYSPYPTSPQTNYSTNYNAANNMTTSNAYPSINRSHAPTQRSVEVYQMLATQQPQAQVNYNGIPRLSKTKPTAANNLQLQGIGRTYAAGQSLNNYGYQASSPTAVPSMANKSNPTPEAYAAAAVNEMQIRPYEPSKAVPDYRQSPMPINTNGVKPITYTLGTTGQTYQMGNPNPISPAQVNEAYTTLNYADTASTQRSAMPVENILSESVNAYKVGNYSLAEEKIEQALEMDERNPDIYQALAEIKVKQGQTQAAVTAYEKAMSLKPALNNQRYAELLILANQKTQALKVLETLAPNNNQAEINYMLGTLYEESGQMDKAVTYLERAVAQKPNDLNIQYNLGLAYEYQGNIAKAKTHYLKASQLSPNDVDVKSALNRLNG